MKPPGINLQSHDFDKGLPADRQYFTLRFLAELWDCSQDNVQRLIDEGELTVAVDVAPRTSSKAMQRIPRKVIVDFLERRKSGIFDRADKKSTQREGK